METKDENVPSTARLNFGNKAEAASHADQSADANPEMIEAPETEVEEVVAVTPEENAVSEPEVVEPETETKDQSADKATPADEQVKTVETEATDELEPEIVTGDGEGKDEGPVEVELKAPAATTTDADGKTVQELQEERERLNAQIKARTDAQKASVIEQIKTVVDTYAISVEELVEALGGLKSKRKGVKAKQKYRDPVTGATWSGRGKEPAWIKGQNRDDFLISDVF